MKVILKEDVQNLGIMGNVVDVANGYGRNYLIPRDLAVEATSRNIKYFEHYWSFAFATQVGYTSESKRNGFP